MTIAEMATELQNRYHFSNPNTAHIVAIRKTIRRANVLDATARQTRLYSVPLSDIAFDQAAALRAQIDNYTF